MAHFPSHSLARSYSLLRAARSLSQPKPSAASPLSVFPFLCACVKASQAQLRFLSSFLPLPGGPATVPAQSRLPPGLLAESECNTSTAPPHPLETLAPVLYKASPSRHFVRILNLAQNPKNPSSISISLRRNRRKTEDARSFFADVLLRRPCISGRVVFAFGSAIARPTPCLHPLCSEEPRLLFSSSSDKSTAAALNRSTSW